MHERDRHRALAHARGHTLNRTVSNVAHDKYAGHVCFQQTRLAIELPPAGPLAIAYELRAGIDKPALIAFDKISKPVGVWRGSDHDEQRVGRYSVYFVRLGAVNRDRLEVIFTMRLYDRRVVFDLNVWSSFELIDQVLRH